ncbi:hypothetical protein [Streptomyces sp. NBRC 110035]|uniref:hypothetical protein n=1 Tax=Streptomyces sp. NBRC 110035 TaxID=1547867 RepID=UPI000697A3DC|nr:hypothetical protein [Streptomyces sp. NBRC 110035]
MTTPADELRTAAAKLGPSSPAVAAHTVAVRLHPTVAARLAELLVSEIDYLADGSVAHPTHLTRALAVARAINARP